MEADRELLELAAKAAGFENPHWEDGPWLEARYGLKCAIWSDSFDGYWNPLEDDGDALRLAAALNINLRFDGCGPGNHRGSWSVVALPQIEQWSNYGQS
jgi:hypothetical protein